MTEFRPFLTAKRSGRGFVFARLRHFRRPKCTLRDRLRRQISMSLINLQDFFAFWSASTRRFYARSVTTGAREDITKASVGRPALPPDAQLIGHFTYGEVSTAEILEDVLAAARQPAPEIPAPEPEPPPAIAQPRPILETSWTWARRPFNAPLKESP